MQATEFSLATVHQDASGKAYPRVRTCIFRSFWGELALRDSAREEMRTEGCGENPAVYGSDMLAFTTDVRMEKVGQIESGEDGDGGRAGGEVEAMFWVKDAMTQWRLKGKAFAVGGDGGDSVEKESREKVWAWMRACPGNNEPSSLDEVARSWSWDKEVAAHFANMSPIMRGGLIQFPLILPDVCLSLSSVPFIWQIMYGLNIPGIVAAVHASHARTKGSPSQGPDERSVKPTISLSNIG